MDIVRKAVSAAPVVVSDDTLEYVMSDATVDHLGDVIEPDGWDVAGFAQNPICLFGHNKNFPIGRWENVRVEKGSLRGRLKLADESTSERIGEIVRLVKQGILRAVSVGFRPVAAEPLPHSKSGGLRYLKQKLVECSLVSVPANPNALQIAKDLHVSADTRRLVFGEKADETGRAELFSKWSGVWHGEHAAPPSSRKTGPMNSPISKRVEDAQNALVRARDALADITKAENPDFEVVETLTAEVEAKTAEVEKWQRAEKALGVQVVERAETEPTVLQGEILSPRRPFAMPAPPKVTPKELFVRSIVVKALSHLTRRDTDTIRRAIPQYDGDEATKIYIDHATRMGDMELVMRAATAPATTTTSGWASQLVQTVNADFMESLMPASVYPALRARGLRLNFGRNGVISIPTRSATPTIAGSFVGEGSPIPVRQGAFTAATLTPKKMAVISTMTREITQYSVPAIETLVRDAIAEDTAVSIDSVLLDNTAASAIRPAGLRNGVTPLTGTAGADFDAAVTDILAMATELVAATNGNLRNPVWIMNPARALSLSMRQNAGGDFPFQQELGQNQLRGYPIIVSGTVTATRVFFLDAADFASVEGDEPMYDVSDQATLHMEDTTPLAIGTVGTPTTVAAPARSLFQTDSLAIRMILPMNWIMRRSGVISITDTVTW